MPLTNQDQITIETRNELVGYCNTYSSYIYDCQNAYLLITNGTLYIDNVFEIYRNTIFNIADTFEKNDIVFWDDSYHLLKKTIMIILKEKLEEASSILYMLMLKYIEHHRFINLPNAYKLYLKKHQKEINKYKEICSYLKNFSLKKELAHIIYELALYSYPHNKTLKLTEVTKEYKELLVKLDLSEELEKVLSNKKLTLTKK